MGSVLYALGGTPAGSRHADPPVVCWFEECRKDAVPLVGGKCSSLGELINAGVRVPPGFALTTEGYRRFMAGAGVDLEVASLLAGLATRNEKSEAVKCYFQESIL